jgi:hypothetical protein
MYKGYVPLNILDSAMFILSLLPDKRRLLRVFSYYRKVMISKNGKAELYIRKV